MDEKEFKTRVSRLEQVAKVLEKLPAEIRISAFDLLKGYITEHSQELDAKKTKAKDQIGIPGSSEEAFFGTFNQEKPSENAKLIAAYFYREYGVEPFSTEEIQKKASDVGITIPSRLDMTFLGAAEKGKKLFVRAGIGKFKPTVNGEAYLKATYSVQKGTKKRAETSE